jgi:rhodanese-related sulfurtransferase
MTQAMNVTDAVKFIKNGDAILIDVREADEFKACTPSAQVGQLVPNC